MNEILQVSTTANSRDQADQIAAELVGRRLAACVQIVGPITSVYRWNDEVETSEEWLCVIKTHRHAVCRITSAVRELHTYDCPEIIATPIVDGSPDYLRWLVEQVERDA